MVQENLLPSQDTGAYFVQFEWAASLPFEDKLQLIDLIDTVSTRETTLGYFEVLGREAGLKLMDSIEGDLLAGRCHLLIARTNGRKIVGTATLTPSPLPARSHITEMKRCVIHPEHRGKFLSEGWRLALHKVREIGCEMVVMDARSDGRAEQLWRHLGMHEFGHLDDYARVRGRVIRGYFFKGYVDELLKRDGELSSQRGR